MLAAAIKSALRRDSDSWARNVEKLRKQVDIVEHVPSYTKE